MDFGQAFTYVFEDRNWVGKIVQVGIMTLLMVIPILGLLAVAAVMGYMVELVGNVRNGHPRPLPQWLNYGDLMVKGGHVLIASIVYMLPIIFLYGCLFASLGALGSGIFGALSAGVLTLCILPFSLVYSLVAGAMLASGIAEFSETGNGGAFYRIGDRWAMIRSDASLTGQWLLYSFAANLLLSLLGAIPCLGWLAFLGLAIPVQGHLVGQYALRLGADKAKGKPKV